MKRFGLTLEQLRSGAVRVAPRGELDLEHAYSFDEELRRVEDGRPPCIVLDLRELGFMIPAASPGCWRRNDAPAALAAGCCSCAALGGSSVCWR